jgi:class 3 adenylate cyclase
MSMKMQRRMEELQQKWFNGGCQRPFHIRIGINTGVASVGDFGSAGRRTYSAIGNQTNLAARIQDRSDPGGVLVSHSTWALVKDEFECESRGEIEVKGIHYPVNTYAIKMPPAQKRQAVISNLEQAREKRQSLAPVSAFDADPAIQ